MIEVEQYIAGLPNAEPDRFRDLFNEALDAGDRFDEDGVVAALTKLRALWRSRNCRN